MYRFLFFICGFFCLTLLRAQPLAADEQKMFAQMMADQQQYWNNGNIDGYMSYYWNSDSLIFISKGKRNMGWQKTCDNYKKKYPDAASRGRLEFSNMFFYKLDSKKVIATGGWKLVREAGNLEGSFTLIWKKIGGRWVIIIDHTV